MYLVISLFVVVVQALLVIPCYFVGAKNKVIYLSLLRQDLDYGYWLKLSDFTTIHVHVAVPVYSRGFDGGIAMAARELSDRRSTI